MKIKIKCNYCKKTVWKETGAVNRAKNKNAPLFCGRTCAGLSHRKNKTKEQRIKEKAEYDKEYRDRNKERLKKVKAEWFQKTYDPEKAKIERKKKMHLHIEYCRKPEYKKWKKEYDRKYRAKTKYGEYWECFLLTQDIQSECEERQSKYDMRLAAGTLNKAQRRKRDAGINRNKSEECTMGDTE